MNVSEIQQYVEQQITERWPDARPIFVDPDALPNNFRFAEPLAPHTLVFYLARPDGGRPNDNWVWGFVSGDVDGRELELQVEGMLHETEWDYEAAFHGAPMTWGCTACDGEWDSLEAAEASDHCWGERGRVVPVPDTPQGRARLMNLRAHLRAQLA